MRSRAAAVFAGIVLGFDLVLTGVIVPAGTRDLVVRFRSTWFATGQAISGIAWIIVIAWSAVVLKRSGGQK